VPSEQKVVFMTEEKLKAEFKIKLHRDDMSQVQFFNGVIAAYLNEHEDFLNWFSQYRAESNSHRSRGKRHLLEKEEQLARANISKFGLDENDIESIFDLIEQSRLEP